MGNDSMGGKLRATLGEPAKVLMGYNWQVLTGERPLNDLKTVASIRIHFLKLWMRKGVPGPVDTSQFRYIPEPVGTFRPVEPYEEYASTQAGFTSRGEPLRDVWLKLMRKCWCLDIEKRVKIHEVVADLKTMRKDLEGLD